MYNLISILLISTSIFVTCLLISILVKLVRKFIVLYDGMMNPDVTKQKHGIVYHKNTKKLEADQSIILPS